MSDILSTCDACHASTHTLSTRPNFWGAFCNNCDKIRAHLVEGEQHMHHVLHVMERRYGASTN